MRNWKRLNLHDTGVPEKLIDDGSETPRAVLRVKGKEGEIEMPPCDAGYFKKEKYGLNWVSLVNDSVCSYEYMHKYYARVWYSLLPPFDGV